MPERYAAAAQPFCDGLLLWYRLQFTTAHATVGARCVGRLFHFLSFAPWTSSFNNLAGWSRFFSTWAAHICHQNDIPIQPRYC